MGGARSRDGGFDRFVFRFDGAHGIHDCRVTRGVAPIGAVFVTTPGGVCIARVDEGLEVFSARPGSAAVETVAFEMLGDATLLEHDGAVLHVHGHTIERLTYRVPMTESETESQSARVPAQRAPKPICRG
jgi:hypothetical protein